MPRLFKIMLDSTIEWINHHRVDTMYVCGNCLIHWVEIYMTDSVIQLLNNLDLASVVQKVDNAIHWVNLHPVDSLIGSLHDLIMWSTFSKHEYSTALLKNFISTSWKSILKLGNLRIFSPISQKWRLQRSPKVRSICMRKTTFAIQSRLHGFAYKSL